MGDELQRKVIEIIVEAQNRAGAGLAEAAGELESFQATAMGIGTKLAGVGAGMLVAGGGLAAGIGLLVDKAAEFDSTITTVRNNTTMSDADMEAMRQTVLKLGAEAPVSLDNLAQGFMHVSNFGFSAADATQVLAAAMRSAVSTGGDTAKTAEVLAAAMHEFNIPAAQASQTMDMLHTAAAEGNMTLEQFSDSFGQVAAWAAAVGVPLDQAAAAMSALTRHGFDASTAATQVKDEIAHMINPSSAAKKEISALSEASGVDLVNAFSAAGLHSLGLTGILDMTHDAMDKLGMSADAQTAAWMKIIPNIRGGAASFVLAGRGAEDFSSILSDLHTQMGVTDEAFARSQQTVKFQWGVLTNQVQELGIALGEALLPAITQIGNAILPVAKQFADWATAHTDLIAKVLIGATAFLLIGGAIATVAGLVLMLMAVLNPVGLAILGIVAAGAVLAAAWATDFGGMRSTIEHLWTDVQDAFTNGLATIQNVVQTVLGIVQRVWAEHGAAILAQAQQIWGGIQRFIQTAWGAVSTFIQREGGVIVAWFQENWPLIQQTIATVLDKIATLTQTVLTAVVGWWTQHGETVRAVVSATWDALTTIVDTAIHTILDLLKIAMQLINGDWGGAWETFKDLVSRQWDAIKQLVRDGGDTVIAIVRDVGNSLVDHAGDWAAAGLQLAGGLIQGILGGLGNLAGQLVSAITAAIQQVRVDIGPFHLSASGFTVDMPTMPTVSVPAPSLPPAPSIPTMPAVPGASVYDRTYSGPPGRGQFSVPALASGGIVSRPTLALVGEAGPEAVVPLGRLGRGGGGGGDITVTVTGNQFAVQNDDAAGTGQYVGQRVARFMDDLRRELERSTTSAAQMLPGNP